ncbi:MAG TPA: UvrD-helicase domain-containing protein, partial [Candidatus Acidoferrales bacterium]|nr:UvrD-helicase domain-containing protein [Candidatus Acidoferrales bacterium]
MTAPPTGRETVTPLDPLTVALHGTTLIEASAGTGKTHTITTLYVRLLLERELSVEQILVVTYTNAATGELRARIRRRLHDVALALAGAAADDEALRRLVAQRVEAGKADIDRLRLLNALHSFDQAAIFTIHGFCQRMLQEHAFESGVAFETELVADQRPLLDQVVRDFWVRELHAAPYPFVLFAQGKNTRFQQIERLATLAVTHPEMPIIPTVDDTSAAGAVVTVPGDEPTGDELNKRWLRMQVDAIAYARSELQRRKAQAHQQSFDDLLLRLVSALRASGGEGLARRIRERLRAALIDEFQDTDPLQYEIFRRIYHDAPGAPGESGAALFLIGDPKQAIYAFRGADVFTYLEAKCDAALQHTLLTNYRSDPTLVAGINALFQNARAPFLFDEITFHKIAASPHATDRLVGSGAPLEILFVPRRGQEARGSAIPKTWAPKLAEHVAGDIVERIRSSATLNGRALVPSDFAVLCRKNDQAIEMQQALRGLNLPSVLQGDSSVFDSFEAEEIARVLRAIAEPSDNAAVRAALSTTLLGVTAAELFALQTDEPGWDKWLRRFQDWSLAWARRGFIAAFRSMIEQQDVVPRLLAFSDGERRLTNVLHLIELLHTASVDEHLGRSALVNWLAQMRGDEGARTTVAAEAAQIRLESDDAAIKLVTIHKSKGLQYPIVYCPYLWEGKPLRDNDKATPRFHDPNDNNRLKLDIGSSSLPQHQAQAEREAMAEALRLLYVAVTRAQHACTVVWGAFNSSETSALGYLLHAEPPPADPVASARERIKSLRSSKRDDGMRDDLRRLAEASEGAIAVRDLKLDEVEPWTSGESATTELSCRVSHRNLSLRWRTASFSSLTRSTGTITRPAEAGIDHDAGTDVVAEGSLPGVEMPVVLHEFPAGTRTGQILHRIFEQFDFRQTDLVALRQQAASSLEEGGVDPKWAADVASAVADVLDTPLDAHGMRLRDVPADKRLNELEFLL